MKKSLMLLLVGLLALGLSSCGVNNANEPNALGADKDANIVYDGSFGVILAGNGSTMVSVTVTNNHATKTLKSATFRIDGQDKLGTMILPARSEIMGFPADGLVAGDTVEVVFTLETTQKSEKDLVQYFVDNSAKDIKFHAAAAELIWN